MIDERRSPMLSDCHRRSNPHCRDGVCDYHLSKPLVASDAIANSEATDAVDNYPITNRGPVAPLKPPIHLVVARCPISDC